ncbi:amino acid/amide ABC transporter ATP-binding protein 2 (HAAT family) [Dongia mobilis]|uniref:Amino acid/amide ABC transporter ATP-binding protein 2 (HAAT family) n=1 Tax=Dongia mobilis TaxID=578943 RepID=A0A4R6WNV1_9PROT|nr:ABC transporter ATP-binding protein [Dongia mobilis]TDQ80650.1 amino acid/amide ABC transporter ATP-binding protein 2 (HAAT family) [Dongia mobilis]
MLKVDAINVFYGSVQVLRDVTFDLNPGEILCLLGRNGAGKTTILKSVIGQMKPRTGRISLEDIDLTALPPHEVPKQGIGYVPQGRRLFAELSVEENLQMGLLARRRGGDVRARVLDLFPVLRERLGQRAGTLSGGEQQMLATARALCLEPRILLLDEPTEGLMPIMIAKILEIVGTLREMGVATILVEQRVESALHVADRIAFIENGRVAEVMTPDRLRDDPRLLHQYVGVGVKG